MNISNELLNLAQEAETLDSSLLVDSEAAFENFLQFILNNLEYRHQLIDEFKSIAMGKIIVPSQLIQYCIHALRWPELLVFFSERLAVEKSERTRHVLRNYLRAFDDDWPGARYYKRFQCGTTA